MIKATGIMRKVDDLGRVVIPIEIRRNFSIEEGDPLEIYTSDNGKIILKKYVPETACIICGNEEDTCTINGKHLCKVCVQTLIKYYQP